MITISKSFFEECVATATDATAEVFELVQPHFDAEVEYLEDFVLGFKTEDVETQLEYLCKKFVCYNAFAKLIPQLDLILTPTGFGVVRTENLAPASPERVNNLLRAITNAAADAIDGLLYYLIKKQPNKWGEKVQASTWITSVFYTGIQLAQYGIRESAHRSDLVALRPRILEAETQIMSRISPELFEALLVKIRTNYGDVELWRHLHVRIIQVVRLHLQQDRRAERYQQDLLLKFVEDNLDTFTAYAESSTYKANHYKPYENRQDDTTFFFGG